MDTRLGPGPGSSLSSTPVASGGRLHPDAGYPMTTEPSIPNYKAHTYNGFNFSLTTGFSPTHPPPMRPPSVDTLQSVSTFVGSRSLPPSIAAISDEIRISIGIDIDVAFSSVAYKCPLIDGGKTRQILNWPGTLSTSSKIPTCLLYDEEGTLIAWGYEARDTKPIPRTVLCQGFMSFLDLTGRAQREQDPFNPTVVIIPPTKRPIDLVVDYLSCIGEYVKSQITRDVGAIAGLDSAEVWLTVPDIWDGKAREIMKGAAIMADLVHAARANDRGWRDRLKLLPQLEATAVHCARTDLPNLRLEPPEVFFVFDAGYDRLSVAAYQAINRTPYLEIAEICGRSYGFNGITNRFLQLVQALLADHPTHLERHSLAYFLENFQEGDLLTFSGPQEDADTFLYPCFNLSDADDPSVGLINGQLALPGSLLRKEVFDPVMEEVLKAIGDQMQKVGQRVTALFLVGEFSGNVYLKNRIQERFGARIRFITRPPDSDTAKSRGAAACGLTKRPIVSSIIVPQSYLMKEGVDSWVPPFSFLRIFIAQVRLPAEPEDWENRPSYIIAGKFGGVAICNNRLQYLISKGSVVRKSHSIKSKYWTRLYTSNSDGILRYTDQAETAELCKWTVDLAGHPVFQKNRDEADGRPFYTEFEIALEIDTAEIRAFLIYEDQEWGRVAFDYFL
ncbi:hypothetical protein M413DRAFT_27891 [Hebeloma cylindrosporum]|uniref:Actin-like ATPase domain-containing protein n=1 Tax=Hebeloma cylindrosporum TaxID=76867 RepID=A0A0C3CD89_HEBCY|nr:hypothetical protein M413DRAFT_27891 [Hebeloma cylindrosporum h7]